jgi:hypothetical protein
MKTETKDVFSQQKKVAAAEYQVFDSIGEAVDTLGDLAVLDLINAQHKTNALNNARTLASAKPSKRALEIQAQARITASEFASVAGDPARIRALIDSKIKEIEAEVAAKAAAEVPA